MEKQLKLKLNFDPNIPKYLMGDSMRIYRILVELLSNALKFTKQGQVILSATLSKIQDHDIVITMTVEDTGIGIPEEKQKELYLRFKRLTPSYRGIYKGSGLGLSIVKQFIDDLGGEVYLESCPDVGTKFTCLLPLKESLLDNAFGAELNDLENTSSL